MSKSTAIVLKDFVEMATHASFEDWFLILFQQIQFSSIFFDEFQKLSWSGKMKLVFKFYYSFHSEFKIFFFISINLMNRQIFRWIAKFASALDLINLCLTIKLKWLQSRRKSEVNLSLIYHVVHVEVCFSFRSEYFKLRFFTLNSSVFNIRGDWSCSYE